MLRHLIRIAAISCLTVPAAAGAQKFEGVVTVRMAAGPNGMDATYMIKGDQFRMDMAGRAGMSMYILRDASTNSSLMVMPSQRMYFDASAMGARGQSSAESKPANIKMTGKKEMIAGHECEHILITGDTGEQFDVCGAEGLGSFMMPSNPMGGRSGASQAPAWGRLAGKFFPLKVQQVGGSEIAFEVTKIEKKSLADDLFKVPDGFQKMDMGRMGRPPL